MSTERQTVLLAVALAVAAAAGCRQDMHDQPRYEPQEPSAFFADGRASRPRVEGTVARGELDRSSPEETGRRGRAYLPDPPVPITLAVLERGRERFDIYCAVCHDRAGTGRGMIVRRGFRRPPSLHVERLREAAAGYVFEAITEGFGVMPGYARQISVDDRWAIVAYVRALQLAQNARLADVPEAERAELLEAPE